jgi:hypothetical protein
MALLDTFTTGADTNLDSHTSDSGHTWTWHSSGATTKRLTVYQSPDTCGRSTAGSTNVVTWYSSSWTPAGTEYDVEWDWVYKSGSSITPCRVVARAAWSGTTLNDAYEVVGNYNTGSVTLNKVVAGVTTALGSHTLSPWSAPQTDAYKLEIRDATKKVFVNAVEVISTSDNAVTAAGLVGLGGGTGNGAAAAGLHWDNLTADDFISGGGATVTPAAGQLDLTGFAPQISKSVSPAAGQLDLTGFAPQISKSVSPAAGQLDLTGFAPIISVVGAIKPGTGQLDLTGFAPAAAKTVSPGNGQLDLTGFAPTLGVTLASVTGQLLLTGFEPTVVSGAGGPLIPGTGQLVLTGYEPRVSTPKTVKAWAFVLDGHIFYVLNGVDGVTLVFDARTGQWHHWYTDIVPADWNAYRGVMWKGRPLVADEVTSEIWELDPSSMLDQDAIQIKRVVTGFQAMRGKASVRQGALRVTASVGEPTLVGATLELRFSDDEGQTWSVTHSKVLQSGVYDQPLKFRSLGRIRAPGRIWEISDVGGLVTIEGADADLEGQ